MEPLARLPVFFVLEGRRVIVAGGTPAAAWKAELLSAAGAQVEVFATESCEEMLALASDPPREKHGQSGPFRDRSARHRGVGSPHCGRAMRPAAGPYPKGVTAANQRLAYRRSSRQA